ncbi:MAG TPA: four helix bundle protein [Candidatus Omnitrophota bacterium]|nr:four helix bundle protein [Candidatus Omnitrophota bacterium]HPD85191.1 four helix bundle protein [Candidatus Omnitrophota bacterium]HRZ04308.1 four helix bundle protein [Candidatus Omnitrophota bacterium]
MSEEKPYEKLKFYQDICEIRKIIHSITERFDKSNLRLISQMRDAARSAKQNIREGYSKGTLGEFIHSIRISKGSLEELSGDMEDCLEDKLITASEYKKFFELYQSASYMSTQYIKAMSQSSNKGKWKVMGKD